VVGHKRGGGRRLTSRGGSWSSRGPLGGVGWAEGWPEQPDDSQLAEEVAAEGNRLLRRRPWVVGGGRWVEEVQCASGVLLTATASPDSGRMRLPIGRC
jgi:hypothetical protein